jgi:hypothetical protein
MTAMASTCACAHPAKVGSTATSHKSDEKQIKIGLSAYPTITLAMARELTREANALRAQGITTRRTLDESSKSNMDIIRQHMKAAAIVAQELRHE